MARLKSRFFLAVISLIVIAVLSHYALISTHVADLKVVNSVSERPLDVNLPLARRLPFKSNFVHPSDLEREGFARFENCGSRLVGPLIESCDLRYSYRVTHIYMAGQIYTDSSITRFGELAHLRKLDLVNTRVSAAAIASLKEQLPNLTVTRRPT